MAQASYLVSFVKSLIENDNKLILEQNKTKLKEDYLNNGASLNKNLADKYEQVSKILSVYKYISERVKANRAGVSVIKSNLSECKRLLQCNKDALRRLWLELVEKRNCVRLLEALEEVKLAPDLVTCLTESKSWFEATIVVLKSQKKIQDGLENVQAVLPIRTDISIRQKTLIDRIKSDLHKMIFDDSLAAALKSSSTFGERGTSIRGVGKKVAINSLESAANSSLPANLQQLSLSQWHNDVVMENEFWTEKAEMFDIRNASKNMNTTKDNDDDDVTEDSEGGQRSSKPRNILSAIFSLYEVGKLQELLNNWSYAAACSSSSSSSQTTANDDITMTTEDRLGYIRGEIFKLIVIKSIEHIKRSAISQNDNRLENYEDCRYLLELLELLYTGLFQCQSALLLMHSAIRYLINSKKTNLSLVKFEDLQLHFDEHSVRRIIQNEIKSLLNAHLVSGSSKSLNAADKVSNISGGNSSHSRTGAAPLNAELLKMYFGKKKGLLSGGVAAISGNIQVVSYSTGQQSLHLGGSSSSSSNNAVHYSDMMDGGMAMTGGGGIGGGMGMGGGGGPSGMHCSSGGGGVDSATGSSGGGASGAAAEFGSNLKQPLFKFANSSHALSVSACLRELRPVTYNIDQTDRGPNSINLNNPTSYPVVCKPYHNNITYIYNSVMDFIDTLEMEEQIYTKSEFRKRSLLRDYVENFIEKVFLKESWNELNSKLNGNFREPGSSIKGLHNLVSQANERELGLQRPIISIMLTADQCLEEVKRITKALHNYTKPSLRNGYYVIEEFKNNLWNWYREITALDLRNEVHMSTEWGKDNDIIRLWKTMPSWQNMNHADMKENIQSPDYGHLNIPMSFSSDGLQSPGGFQLSNKQFMIINETADTTVDTLMKEREARLLVNKESEHDLKLIEDEVKSSQKNNAGKHDKNDASKNYYTFTVFQKNEIIKQLARLHESVAWFVVRMARFINWISNNLSSFISANKDKSDMSSNSGGGGSATGTGTGLDMEYVQIISDYKNLCADLQHLADACLMTIHMEGRLRAYNSIIRLPYEAYYGLHLDEVDVDPQVSELIKSLNDMEFALNHSLTRHKFRFIFEGLGNFMSALFVQILPKIRKMTTSGVKKMCRNIYLIQQTLSTLTQSHEMDLVRVKQLYELLHLTPEAIVDKIMEQGAVFDEEVYRSILQIYKHSNPVYNHDKLKACMMRLGEVINMKFV